MLQTDSRIENYCLSKSRVPSAVCEELYQYTVKNIPYAQMLIGPMVGSFLGFLVGVIGAKRVLEVGCFTGYSALSMAERLPFDGELITLDISEDTTKIGVEFWKKTEHGKKIKLILGAAIESMKTLKAPFDLILIDADKQNYLNYLKRGLELLSPRGVIVLDNCLWSGQVADASVQDAETVALREVADYVRSRAELSSMLLPIRDGLLMVQRNH